jgi:anti-anti-sigma factor
VTPIARVEEAWHGELPVVAVHGEIDASNARELGDRFRALLTNRLAAMVIDLAGTTYLDSAGINLLFSLGEEMRGRQQRLAVVVGAGSPIERMTTLTGLGQQVLVSGSAADAVAQLTAS